MKSSRSWQTFSSPADYIRLCSTIDVDTGCWNWLRAKIQGGYGQAKYDGVRILAHRLSYQTFNGPLKKNRCICHRCDNPSCVNPGHLFQGTYYANLKDAINKGRHLGGFPQWAVTKNRQRKLTDEAVRAIRVSTEPLSVLATRFDTSMTNISLIRRGKRKKLVV